MHFVRGKTYHILWLCVCVILVNCNSVSRKKLLFNFTSKSLSLVMGRLRLWVCVCVRRSHMRECINAFLCACKTLKSEEMQCRVHEEDGTITATIITAAFVLQQQDSRAVSDPKADIFSLFLIQVYMCTRSAGCVFYVLSSVQQNILSACGMGSIYYVHFGVYTCTLHTDTYRQAGRHARTIPPCTQTHS